jgi:hypothetical protein
VGGNVRGWAGFGRVWGGGAGGATASANTDAMKLQTLVVCDVMRADRTMQT